MEWKNETREIQLSWKTSCEVSSDRTEFKSTDALLFHHGELAYNML
jgi:hypothetical protein